MHYIDISWPISAAMTAYKDRSVVCITPTKLFERDAVRESLITLGSHTGTHIDAPAHFIADGVTTDDISLDALVGPCTVIDMAYGFDVITREHLIAVADQLQPDTRILFKTRNSVRSATDLFDAHFVYIDKEAALYLAQCKLKAVGIDYLGIERDQPGHETHITLLNAGVVIIEGLRLGHVSPGDYFLHCLPLALVGSDGAPARAILSR
ncbi:cyclase family protein [Candidatus Dependentiae bacterium]|nr:cyclase family protein [Candidatus Dependentiae bacterium]MCC7415394.1 cyclase family protein [Campylobacterota bacterium]